MTITAFGDSRPAVATMRWRSVCLSIVALFLVTEVQTRLGKPHILHRVQCFWKIVTM